MKNEGRGRKGFRGVITVEMSYLIPMVLLLFLLVVYTVFYYHDKNILIGAASETAVTGAQMERRPDKKGQVGLEELYQERIQGKLVFFSGIQVFANVSEKWVEISACAERGKMKIHVLQRAAVAEPEKAVRRKRMLKSLEKTDDTDSAGSAGQISSGEAADMISSSEIADSD